MVELLVWLLRLVSEQLVSPFYSESSVRLKRKKSCRFQVNIQFLHQNERVNNV